MAKSAKERSRARSIRQRVLDGIATADQSNWLEVYERSRTARNVDEPKPAPDRTGPAPPSPGPDRTEPPGVESAAESRAKVQAGHVMLEFPADPTPPADGGPPGGASGAALSAPGAPAPTCSIPNCPQCKSIVGSQECAVTGGRVWPPMSIQSGRSMASMILGLIGLALKFFRKDKFYVAPTKEEKEMLAEALVLVQHRRASWIGAFDDLIQLGGAIGGYSTRALATKPPKDDADKDKKS